MNEHIRYVTGQIQDADTLPALLTAAFYGLETVERATALLAETTPENHRTDCDNALTASVDAWWALSDAPTWSSPGHSTPAELAARTSALVLLISQTLLQAANKTSDPADRIACLTAVHHAGRVHDALKEIG
ncbi:hypothetical protein [Actinomadura harenae]|uniref:Uncharacterized protein n=1 Tax=Actinomadura harenae TaxID=2483351 RepID=A0A3M2M2Q6_9ACTN|nr:hypothetical protein [Actinomadura harenae]RMI43921.1 hypothetical protein EBO15_14555 [Actinomadura harenae]